MEANRKTPWQVQAEDRIIPAPQERGSSRNMMQARIIPTPQVIAVPQLISSTTPTTAVDIKALLERAYEERIRAGVLLRTSELPQQFSFYRPPSVPSISSPSRNSTKVLALIDIQCFNGPWNAESEGQLPILGFEIPTSPPQDVSDEAWVTMLIVKFLEERILGEEGVWGLVVEKAREYVRTRLGVGGDLHLLEEMVGVVITSES